MIALAEQLNPKFIYTNKYFWSSIFFVADTTISKKDWNFDKYSVEQK